MILYPAIDVLDGRVVRLAKGDFNAVTDYGGDPAAIARSYEKAGAQWLHLVDLSGARDGRRRQTDLVQTLSDTGLKIQTGGGVRTSDDAGADRVVVGSLAVTRPETVQDWLRRYGPEAIAAAFDVRIENGAPWPVVKGWTERAEFTLGELLAGYARSGLRHALATDVGRDGMLGGPNTDLYRDLARSRPDIAWQASGGVSSLDDLAALKAAGASGAIIGRALFENRFTLDAALAC
jgi:phosphoribosylformimino-5-aminoimidazole carboxamide ribotide isomerase